MLMYIDIAERHVQMFINNTFGPLSVMFRAFTKWIIHLCLFFLRTEYLVKLIKTEEGSNLFGKDYAELVGRVRRPDRRIHVINI